MRSAILTDTGDGRKGIAQLDGLEKIHNNISDVNIKQTVSKYDTV